MAQFALPWHLDLISLPAKPFANVGIFPGTFNPVTNAHVAMAMASLRRLDAVFLVLPRTLPHKRFEQATLDQRLSMLELAAAVDSRLGVAVSSSGLVFEMVEEARAIFENGGGSHITFHVICGRDAAERYLSWNYGESFSIKEMLKNFRLLVAARDGEFQAPKDVAPNIDLLALRTSEAEQMEACSSTRLREALAAKDPQWRQLAPEPIQELIEAIYRVA